MGKISHRLLFIIVLILTVILLALILFSRKQNLPANSVSKKQTDFPTDVKACNGVDTNLRFSCYRSVIESHFQSNVEAFADELKNDKTLSFEATYGNNGKISYAIFGTNCHTFYHAAGDYMATHSNENVEKILDLGPTTCTNGYTMGVYKRLALKSHFSMDLLEKFYEVCKKGAENQCAHEIGHVLHDKYSYSVLKILDSISASQYHVTYPQKYDYVTFVNSGSADDLDKPFEDCKKIMPDQNKLAQCYTGIGHNLFLFAEFSKDGYKSMLSECAKTQEKNKNNCYAFLVYRIGINEAATQFLSHEYEAGRKVCEDVVVMSSKVEMKEHCYRGIGGGIGLFVDSEYALTDINEKNLVSVKNQLTDYLKLCEQSDEKFVDSCFAGLFGTKFAKFYDLLKIYYEPIEKLRPTWDSDFEVVG